MKRKIRFGAIIYLTKAPSSFFVYMIESTRRSPAEKTKFLAFFDDRGIENLPAKPLMFHIYSVSCQNFLGVKDLEFFQVPETM